MRQISSMEELEAIAVRYQVPLALVLELVEGWGKGQDGGVATGTGPPRSQIEETIAEHLSLSMEAGGSIEPSESFPTIPPLRRGAADRSSASTASSESFPTIPPRRRGAVDRSSASDSFTTAMTFPPVSCDEARTDRPGAAPPPPRLETDRAPSADTYVPRDQPLAPAMARCASPDSPSLDSDSDLGSESALVSESAYLPPRYRDLGPIGSGGMGTVRRVFDRTLNRPVAMKMVRETLALHPTAALRFMEEAKTTAQLQHPGIVPVYDAGRLPNGQFYFTMKEVRGQAFSEILTEVQQQVSIGWGVSASGWTFRRVMDLFHKVCEALAYAHDRQVVHRDLKPDNIMVGAFGEMQVMDWGLAKLLEGSSRLDSAEELPVRSGDGRHLLKTQVGTVTGTPAYMAPEQARGDIEAIGPGTDVFALGAILYHILFGRPPYRGDSVATLLQKAILAQPDLPFGAQVTALALDGSQEADRDHRESRGESSTDAKTVVPLPEGSVPWGGVEPPATLIEICTVAMASSVNDRFPHAGALAQAVADWLDDAQKRARALTLVEKARALPAKRLERLSDAASLREEAAAQLEPIPTWEGAGKKAPAWALLDRAALLEQAAEEIELRYTQKLNAALSVCPDLPEAHQPLADFYRDKHEEAEALGDRLERTRTEALLRAHDVAHHHADYLRGHGRLSVETDPGQARATLFRYVEHQRRLVLEHLEDLGTTPILDHELPMGSYLVRLEATGCIPVDYPFRLTRMARWSRTRPGDDGPSPIYLPPVGTLRQDECYVPAGWYVCGGDRKLSTSLPLRRVWVDGFAIGRFPITHGQYLRFLNDLLEDKLEEMALTHVPRPPAAVGSIEPSPLYARDERGRFFLSVDPEGDVIAPDHPVNLVSWHSARAYAAWWSRRTGLCHRLPGELEWEKAARGGDRRIFPWGDFADPAWACMKGSLPGGDTFTSVTRYPDNVSPYGVRDMVGNACEWCLDGPYDSAWPASSQVYVVPDFTDGPGLADEAGPHMVRGGFFGSTALGIRVARRMYFRGRDNVTGFRLVRSLGKVRQ